LPASRLSLLVWCYVLLFVGWLPCSLLASHPDACRAVPGPAARRLEAAFGVPVLEAYAMTEASHQMTSNPLPKHGARVPGSVGRAQGSVQVRGGRRPVCSSLMHARGEGRAPTDNSG